MCYNGKILLPGTRRTKIPNSSFLFLIFLENQEKKLYIYYKTNIKYNISQTHTYKNSLRNETHIYYITNLYTRTEKLVLYILGYNEKQSFQSEKPSPNPWQLAFLISTEGKAEVFYAALRGTGIGMNLSVCPEYQIKAGQ